MAKVTLEQIASRLERLEKIHLLEAELLSLKLGVASLSVDSGLPVRMKHAAAAKFLGMSPKTLDRRVEEGLLPKPQREGSNKTHLTKDLQAYARNQPRGRRSSG